MSNILIHEPNYNLPPFLGSFIYKNGYFLQHLELEINFIFEGKNSTEAANQSLNVPVASSSKKEREHPMNECSAPWRKCFSFICTSPK